MSLIDELTLIQSIKQFFFVFRRNIQLHLESKLIWLQSTLASITVSWFSFYSYWCYLCLWVHYCKECLSCNVWWRKATILPTDLTIISILISPAVAIQLYWRSFGLKCVILIQETYIAPNDRTRIFTMYAKRSTSAVGFHVRWRTLMHQE